MVAHAQRRLAAIRAEAAAVAGEVLGAGAGGLTQDRLERDIRVTHSHRRLAGLNIGRDPLIVGRTDNVDGAVVRIGRLAIDDEHRDPLVVDWRAPVAEPFYRATPLEPMGLVRRRHYQYRAGELVGMEDELFDGERAHQDGLVLVGEAALLAALGRRRTGRMADIVATIQREQDLVIRSALRGVLVVQGGPGTGKTAVALHRAAFLLYTHRFPLETTGVLLVGPNPRFLRYIEDVLPSLGEHAVTLATPATLVAGIEATGRDDPAAARVKGDLRMLAVLARAIVRLTRPLKQDLVVPSGPSRLTLTVEDSRRIVARARRSPGTHHQRRQVVERLVRAHLAREEMAARRRLVAAGRLGPDAGGPPRRRWLEEKTVRTALERMWPMLEPSQVVTALLTVPQLRDRAAAGTLEPAEAAVLGPGVGGWTPADAALIEEASLLLGQPARPRQPKSAGDDVDAAAASAELLERVLADQVPDCLRCGSGLDWRPRERRWVCSLPACGRSFVPDQVVDPARQHLFESVFNHMTAGTGRGEELEPDAGPGPDRIFGHVVVDEAQDLSPLQWRLLARRCPSRSMTVAGDLAQASGPWAPSGWREALGAALDEAPGVPLRETELTVNYRTPEEVMAVAARELAVAAPERAAPVSARPVGGAPCLMRVRGGRELVEATAQAMSSAAEELPGGLVVAIAPAALHPAVQVAAGETGLVLSLDEAKGLEFDAVVVCEPGALVAEHPHGLAALYVALTRTTNRLTVVATGPLPAGLDAAFRS